MTPHKTLWFKSDLGSDFRFVFPKDAGTTLTGIDTEATTASMTVYVRQETAIFRAHSGMFLFSRA